jgi:hypothetical protein
VLLGGREPSMEGSEADSLHGKAPDEDQLAVDIPETAHQISKGFLFVLLSLPLSFSFFFFSFFLFLFSSFLLFEVAMAYTGVYGRWVVKSGFIWYLGVAGIACTVFGF